eukprot:PLAT1336.2.p1 GENE.PLAT1336.2~~PLAT1336.2.p1  ORF type:complete len:1183 (+),score=591.12 PLAT1336.2:374-3550(+)
MGSSSSPGRARRARGGGRSLPGRHSAPPGDSTLPGVPRPERSMAELLASVGKRLPSLPSDKADGSGDKVRWVEEESEVMVELGHDVPPSRIPHAYYVKEASPLFGTLEFDDSIAYDAKKKQFHRLVFPSSKPTTRDDAIYLAQACDVMLAQIYARSAGDSAAESEETDALGFHPRMWAEMKVWNMVLSELVRQVFAQCDDRGALLERTRSRLLQLFSAAEVLFRRQRSARVHAERLWEASQRTNDDLLQQFAVKEEDLNAVLRGVVTDRSTLAKELHVARQQIVQLQNELQRAARGAASAVVAGPSATRSQRRASATRRWLQVFQVYDGVGRHIAGGTVPSALPSTAAAAAAAGGGGRGMPSLAEEGEEASVHRTAVRGRGRMARESSVHGASRLVDSGDTQAQQLHAAAASVMQVVQKLHELHEQLDDDAPLTGGLADRLYRSLLEHADDLLQLGLDDDDEEEEDDEEDEEDEEAAEAAEKEEGEDDDKKGEHKEEESEGGHSEATAPATTATTTGEKKETDSDEASQHLKKQLLALRELRMALLKLDKQMLAFPDDSRLQQERQQLMEDMVLLSASVASSVVEATVHEHLASSVGDLQAKLDAVRVDLKAARASAAGASEDSLAAKLVARLEKEEAALQQSVSLAYRMTHTREMGVQAGDGVLHDSLSDMAAEERRLADTSSAAVLHTAAGKLTIPPAWLLFLARNDKTSMLMGGSSGGAVAEALPGGPQRLSRTQTRVAIMQVLAAKLRMDASNRARGERLPRMEEAVIAYMLLRFGMRDLVATRLSMLLRSIIDMASLDAWILLFARLCGMTNDALPAEAAQYMLLVLQRAQTLLVRHHKDFALRDAHGEHEMGFVTLDGSALLLHSLATPLGVDNMEVLSWLKERVIVGSMPPALPLEELLMLALRLWPLELEAGRLHMENVFDKETRDQTGPLEFGEFHELLEKALPLGDEMTPTMTLDLYSTALRVAADSQLTSAQFVTLAEKAYLKQMLQRKATSLPKHKPAADEDVPPTLDEVLASRAMATRATTVMIRSIDGAAPPPPLVKVQPPAAE